jgi:protein-disulfide isomerase
VNRNLKISLAIVATVAVIVAVLVMVARPRETPAAAGEVPAAPSSVLVRPDSHRLSTALDGKVTVVEFLDLECEVCGAAFPGVERLRAEYGDRVTFVMRYFPIPSHRNAELAARAVEAAGQQGKLEPMYRTMYENQPRWGDQQVSHRDTFLGFARQLGLDMAKFEAALDAPATTERVLKDRADGAALGVKGTPTFFVNGVQFEEAPTYEALKAALDAELAK